MSTWRLDPPAPTPDPRFPDPASDAMPILLALALGYSFEEAETQRGVEFVIPDPKTPGAYLSASDAAVADLLDRGWVTAEMPPRATEAGRYWLRKWLAANRKALRLPKGIRVEELVVWGGR